ncbi:hypothetical protein Clacol_006100 [Clathrus columnatus]|uniref:tripeptidyl-peptidase II n=1 Tax=Clathrus columnatus TaxID=1419009 RepID=A0AAV5AE04_9AGAM|nr:hypothetical protein Clacol_006100 [Clathrus columnatus]
MSGLERKLYDVSDPNSKHYGQYLTKSEVDMHVRPMPNVTGRLNSWLGKHGINPKKTSSAGQHLDFEVSIAQAEKMFNTSFFVYNDTSSDQTMIKTKKYSVPKELKDHISYVYPITTLNLSPGWTLPLPSSPTNTTMRRSTCQQAMTAPCILAQYNIPLDVGAPATNDSNAIMSFLGQAVQGIDLANYLTSFRTDTVMSKVQVEVISVNGGDNLQSNADNSEANADIQMLLGVMPSAKTKVISTAQTSRDGISDLLTAFAFVAEQEPMASVVTMSYGQPSVIYYISCVIELPSSAISETALPIEVATAMCNMIMQMSVRGATFVTGSGDGGVSGVQQHNCTIFEANFPASCPYALAVGATDLSSGTEVVAGFSSGGFSNVFPSPSYQFQIVSSYLDKIGSLNEGLFNTSGRGFPDISVVGNNILLLNAGQQSIRGGTSTSAPIVAGIIAGLNQRRRKEGKNSLGFVQPLFYAHPETMPGWDPVTGLGTPQFMALAEIV